MAVSVSRMHMHSTRWQALHLTRLHGALSCHPRLQVKSGLRQNVISLVLATDMKVGPPGPLSATAKRTVCPAWCME